VPFVEQTEARKVTNVPMEKFNVHESCWYGRIRCEKKMSSRGRYAAWVISHEELLRNR